MPTQLSRRELLAATAALTAAWDGGGTVLRSAVQSAEPVGAVNIGSRRELFVDPLLIDRLSGEAALRLARPHDEGIVIPFDRPWEGAFCGYVTVLHDNDLYRAYYRGLPVAGADGSAAEVTCYAESQDGIRWTKPILRLFEVAGNRDNNVILAGLAPFSHNFSPLIDSRPGVQGEQRYKALAGTSKTGLVAFVSSDALHWRRLRDQPVITGGAFDSQNVAFWSEHEQFYVCYFRTFQDGFRRITRTTSLDFVSWSEPVLMEYGDKPIEHLYTNQTHPYFRAPHVYVSIAARFLPGRQVLTPEQAKAINVDPKYFGDCSDGIFMTTRGGNRYDRSFMDGFIRPGVGLENWVSRTNYPALGVIPTGNAEMSVYANQNYGQPTAHLRRYSLRADGFVSVSAPYGGGELLTKPLTFAGRELTLNFSTSAAGSVRVEFQTAAGQPVVGLTESAELIGNELDRVVHWKSGSDVSALAGKTVRLRFILKDADVYSLRFV